MCQIYDCFRHKNAVFRTNFFLFVFDRIIFKTFLHLKLQEAKEF